jgi:hypothetical protein
MASNNLKFLVIAVIIIVIIAIILISLSFERIGYDEYGILINNFTQKLSYKEEYKEPGLFFIGIEKSFLKFPKYLVLTEFSGTDQINEDGTVSTYSF